MVNKSDVETELKAVFAERFVHLWWNLRVPGLMGETPAELFAREPEVLLAYVQAYRA